MTFGCLGALAFLAAVSGCGRGRLPGEYHAEARVAEGKTESRDPGYSLAEVQAKLRAAPQSLKIHPGGRFTWNTGHGVNEGTWRLDEKTLLIREDSSRGITIQPSLRSDRSWRLGPGGEIIDDRTFSRYNIEIVYRRR